MRTKLFNIWEKLRSSYWFLPSVMAAAALVLAIATIWLDERWTPKWLWSAGWASRNEPEGARALLSSVAGGIITVAGVVFSITIVALSLASQQFGPRLLYNFMRDRGNQFVFGTFIATYLYSLLVLRTIRQGEESFVPHFAVFIGFALAVTSLGVLIYFIHHVAASIQAMTVISSVHEDLQAMIERHFPERYENAGNWQDSPDGALPADFEHKALAVTTAEDGYLQALDLDGLMQIACRHDLLIRLEGRPGHYMVKNSVVAKVLPAGEASREAWEEAVRDAFIFGRQRTQEQDIELLLHDLVEIAVRALSPGINDPHTAITCIDRLGSALAEFAGRAFPSPLRRDSEGRLRLLCRSQSYPDLVEASFNQIRQYGGTHVAVTIRMLEMIGIILPFTRDEAQRESLLLQATMLHRASAQAIAEEFDRAAVHARYIALFELLEREFGMAPGGP